MRRRLVRAAAAGGLLLCVLAGLACGGEERRSDAAPPPLGPGPAAGRQIDPPAAPGSLAPNLSAVGDELLLSWLEPLAEGRHRLLVSRLGGDGWSAPAVVAEGDGFFANWADLPAVAESGDGSLVAHWLAKTGEATYAYSIFLARSLDGGESWTELGQLNDDRTPTEHGFVSWVAEPGGLRAFWLDGREMEDGGDMGLRTARIGEAVGPSELLDDRVCECCATDAALAAGGPLVVYRDRSGEEIRDISVVRRAGAGWTAPAPAAEDGWKIAGCPVNGPALAAAGETAVVAWFTAAAAAPQVRLAWSADGGATFGPAVPIDLDAPAGRVDVVLDGAAGAVVAWLASAGDAAAVRLRRVSAAGGAGAAVEVARTSAARASGFPRLVGRDGILYLAWVDTAAEGGQRIRARALEVERLPPAAAGVR